MRSVTSVVRTLSLDPTLITYVILEVDNKEVELTTISGKGRFSRYDFRATIDKGVFTSKTEEVI